MHAFLRFFAGLDGLGYIPKDYFAELVDLLLEGCCHHQVIILVVH